MGTRPTRECRIRAAMLVTSLLAGAYLVMQGHGRWRTALRPASRHLPDYDVTVDTLIGGGWQLVESDRPDVNSAATTLDGSLKWSTGAQNVTTEFESEMMQRRHHIHLACNDSGNGINSRDIIPASTLYSLLFVRSLLFDPDHRLLFCAVPKVASSTVKMAMALMTGRVKVSRSIDVHNPTYMRRIGLTSLRRRNGTWPQDLTEKLKDWSKFLVVRHPLERVVSAYRDKFERISRWNQYLHNKFGKFIVHRYRRPPSAVYDGAEHNVSFVEFVRFLTDRGLPDSRKLNQHWAPVSDLCRPCHVPYDYVIRLENFDDEAVQLWKAVYGSTTQSVLPTTIRRNMREVRTTYDVTGQYLQQITRPQARRLARLYADDFRLFNYSANIYGIASD